MDYWRDLRRDKQRIVDIRREEVAREGAVGRLIAQVGEFISHPLFFAAATLLHFAWILLNIPAVSPLPAWDPPPFTLLATIASVEAPLLALIILMRQQQDRRIQELREDTSVQTSLHTERETSLLLAMMQELHEDLGVESESDPAGAGLTEPIDPEQLIRTAREDLDREEQDEREGAVDGEREEEAAEEDDEGGSSPR